MSRTMRSTLTTFAAAFNTAVNPLRETAGRTANAQTRRRSRRASAPAPAPQVQPAPEAAPEKAPYVPTAIKLANLGHGQRELKIEGTLVYVRWNGATKSWDYGCGRKKGTAADRGAAFAEVSVLTNAAGFGRVRA